MNQLRVNGTRLWDSLMEIALIGGTRNGGCNRQAATELDGKARNLFTQWCKDIGCTIHVDQIGNIFARREGKNPLLPAVCTGSHLDTQPTGGKFDGVFGVLAGLEILRTLHENNIETEAAIELAVWTNEEGARFQPAMQGSGVFSGVFDLETELNKTDINGLRLKDELQKTGYLGTEIPGERNIGAFFEAHIEQGPILEDQQKQVGIVRLCQGIHWYTVTVKGMESHAGSTPMYVRKDSMVASAQIVSEVEAISQRFENALSTVGFMQVYPNSRNTIPGEITFSVDFRNPDATLLDAMDKELRSFCQTLSEQRDVGIDVESYWYSPPIEFSASEHVKQATESLGYTHMDIYSGAGHDAVNLAKIVPTAMIFIPCEKGISHNEAENTTPEQCEAGANVLLHTLLNACERMQVQNNKN